MFSVLTLIIQHSFSEKTAIKAGLGLVNNQMFYEWVKKGLRQKKGGKALLQILHGNA